MMGFLPSLKPRALYMLGKAPYYLSHTGYHFVSFFFNHMVEMLTCNQFLIRKDARKEALLFILKSMAFLTGAQITVMWYSRSSSHLQFYCLSIISGPCISRLPFPKIRSSEASELSWYHFPAFLELLFFLFQALLLVLFLQPEYNN